MTTLTPLQINDVKRLELEAYERDIKFMFMYYDAITLNYEIKHRPLPNYIMITS